MTSLPLRAAALLAGLLAAAPVLAQAPPPAQSHAVVEKRIADLHSTLKITPSEEAPFSDFANVMRDNAGHMAGLIQARRKDAATMTAVDEMQSFGQIAQAQAEDMQKLVPAFSRLYDALTPQQKKAADLSFRQFTAGQGPGAQRG